MSKLKPRDFEVPAAVPCAHDGCQAAILRVKLKTGIANLCKAHYVFHTGQEAREFCERNGLVTTQQKREFCRTHMPRLNVREPGSDDEVAA